MGVAESSLHRPSTAISSGLWAQCEFPMAIETRKSFFCLTSRYDERYTQGMWEADRMSAHGPKMAIGGSEVKAARERS
jgi:hypothetical protein